MTQDPVVKRVIAALERALTDADAAEGAAYAAAPVARPARDAALDAAKALGAAYQSAAADLYAQGGARNCRTLADMLESDRPAVRLAAQLALEPHRPPRSASGSTHRPNHAPHGEPTIIGSPTMTAPD